MAKPLSVHEQLKQLWFIPHKTLLVLWSMTRFDALLVKAGNQASGELGEEFKEFKSAYNDLP